ncbi:LuxR family transcriptional regulator [Enterobacteriaceae bacterium 4M9]|nr:LuxR family transcriptional regulator [Enterobacteriaceae bacterium 4M9]
MFSIFNENKVLTETLRDYIERKLEPFGLPEYAFTVFSKKDPSKGLIISNYPPEWVETYRENNFQFIDPVILTGFRRITPFAWDENLTLISDLKSSKIFELSKKYNIVNGFSFVAHDYLDNVSLLNLIINNEGRRENEKIIDKSKAELQMILLDVTEQMYNLIMSGKSNYLGENFSPGETKPIFTPKENKVLYWVSRDKTYAEVASMLGISARTVKFHMSNVTKKMGVRNARSAIRLGMELKLIINEDH